MNKAKISDDIVVKRIIKTEHENGEQNSELLLIVQTVGTLLIY